MLPADVAFAIVRVKPDRSLYISDELLLLAMLIEVWVSRKPNCDLIVESTKHDLDLEVTFYLAVCIFRQELVGDFLRYILVLFDRLAHDLHFNIFVTF